MRHERRPELHRCDTCPAKRRDIALTDIGDKKLWLCLACRVSLQTIINREKIAAKYPQPTLGLAERNG